MKTEHLYLVDEFASRVLSTYPADTDLPHVAAN